MVAAYEAGQRHFGENYVDEFVDKAGKMKEEYSDIVWHFIGHIQTNKARALARCLNLSIIETIDSKKLANELNKECGKIKERKDGTVPQINVLVQVLADNSEGTKNGVSVSEADGLVKHIIEKCPYLKFKGLMSMGAIGNVKEFQTMYELK